MSIFTNDNFKATDSLIKASKSVFESEIDVNSNLDQPITEEHILVPGYGVVHRDRARKEAMESMSLASKFASESNHQAAAYHHERAAMFHKALSNPATSINKIAAGIPKIHTSSPPKISEELETTANILDGLVIGHGDGVIQIHAPMAEPGNQFHNIPVSEWEKKGFPVPNLRDKIKLMYGDSPAGKSWVPVEAPLVQSVRESVGRVAQKYFKRK